MTTDPFDQPPLPLREHLDERIEALLDRMTTELIETSPPKATQPEKAGIAKLLIRHSQFGTQRHFEAEKVLLKEKAYGPLLASYNYWKRNFGRSLSDEGPPYDDERS